MHLVLTGEVVQQTKALLCQHEAPNGIPGAQAEVEGEALRTSRYRLWY